MLETLSAKEWGEPFTDAIKQAAIEHLENGRVLYFPQLAFSLLNEEQAFLSADYADPHAKNISFHTATNKLWGVRNLTDAEHAQLKAMLKRFSQHAHDLIKTLLPTYTAHLIVGRTSYRPVEVSNRKTSYRKDDRRLHVDAFPSAPNQGKRILRVFCNINPHNEDRIWRVGEPFHDVASRFLPSISKPLPGLATLLRFLRITKSKRTAYDHYMLHLHNNMKADEAYQQTAPQQEIRFPSGSSWIVQTDDVSHAAMSGRHVLEQTFYLPVSAMQDEGKSPIRVLEQILGKSLT